ncbi:hypothetical protein EKG38_12360 [Shewanella canadensis]|uniref:Uncharacterized protein n=1 Tax=Shewanella canadensis TaxID=271096 RepID=A0A3S0KA28_9GAMM|nr:hypothetical protein [Shewanella canadensis]RTR38936.1 hypothetical protein EKG38_12360 [Shewanella canadensis]
MRIIMMMAAFLTFSVLAEEKPDHVFKCNLLVESGDGGDVYYEQGLSMLVYGDSAMLKIGSDGDWIGGQYGWNMASSETPVYTGSVWNVIQHKESSNGVKSFTTYAFDNVSFPSLAFHEDGSSTKVETVKLSIVHTNFTKQLVTGAETMVLGQCGYFYK